MERDIVLELKDTLTRELESCTHIQGPTLALLGAVTGAYRDCLPMPEFYRKMLEIYKSGHLICGWKGKKENGVFLVY